MNYTCYIYELFFHWGRTDYIQTEQTLMSDDRQKAVNHPMLEDRDLEESHAHDTDIYTSKLNAFTFDHRI